jgi:hypothetical protein
MLLPGYLYIEFMYEAPKQCAGSFGVNNVWNISLNKGTFAILFMEESILSKLFSNTLLNGHSEHF